MKKKSTKKKTKTVKKNSPRTSKKVVKCSVSGCGKKGVNARTHGEH